MKNRMSSNRIKTTLALSFFFTLTILTQHRSDAAESKGNTETGKAVFEKNCIGCHGKTGEGLGPMSRLPNFKEPATMTSRSDKDLFDKITNGGKGTGMPAWGSLLNEKDRWNLVAYIRSLASAPPK
jgi:mono/diheme cytochrome c family protein